MHNLVGQRFGRLIVECDSGERNTSGIKWRCICECGNRKNIGSTDLRLGKTQSCGCLHRETITKHGSSPRSGRTPTYISWNAMRARCRCKNERTRKYYGAAGITVCDRWSDFDAFMADMGPRPTLKHSIDRIDGTKGYEPGNCRWATKGQQVQNMKSNIKTEFRGELLCLAEIARRGGMSKNGVGYRFRNGLRGEELVKP